MKSRIGVITAGQGNQIPNPETDISNILLRFNANDPTKMTLDGSNNLSAFLDSISGLSLTTSSNKPVYTPNYFNGRGALLFPTAGQLVSAAAVAGLQAKTALTIITIGRSTTLLHGSSGFSGNIKWGVTGSKHFYPNAFYGDGQAVTAEVTSPESDDQTDTVAWEMSIYNGAASGNSNRLKYYTNGIRRIEGYTGTISSPTESAIDSKLYMGWAAWPNEVLECIVYNKVFDATDIAKMEEYVGKTYYNNRMILCAGDSLTRGNRSGSYLTDYNNSYPYHLNSAYSSNTLNVINAGVDNARISSLTTRTPWSIFPYLTYASKKIIVVQIGTNNLLIDDSAGTIESALTTYYGYLRTNYPSAKIVANTIPPSNGFFSGPQETVRLAVNTYIAANFLAMGADNYCDIDAAGLMSSDYVADALHFNATGYGKIATKVKPVTDLYI